MNTLRKNVAPAFLLIGIAFVFALALFETTYIAHGDAVTSPPNGLPGTFKAYTFFATSTNQTIFSTTTSATSTSIVAWTNANGEIDKGYFVIAGAKRVTMYFSRGDVSGQGNTGSTNYRVQVTSKVSPTEADWQNYNKLVQNLATTTANITIPSSVTISAATSTLIDSLQLNNDSFYAVRCIALETTDGEHSCAASADF